MAQTFQSTFVDTAARSVLTCSRAIARSVRASVSTGCSESGEGRDSRSRSVLFRISRWPSKRL
eukprot:3241065-Rhodomonas_salina.1